MPCSDSGQSAYYAAQEAEALAKAMKKVEPLLCSACRTLERLGYDFDENPALSNWWAEHKAIDAAREKEEARLRLEAEEVKEIAKKPFNTLTVNDKNLLKKYKYL